MATLAVATYGMPCAIAISGTFLPVPNTLPGSRPDRHRRRRARGRRRRARALHAGVHVRLVVVADVEHVVVALEHAGQAAEADVGGAAVAALRDHADVAAALHAHRGGDAGRHRRRIAEQRVDPRDLPRRLRIRRREHLEAAGGVDGDHLVVRGAHRGVDRVARAERLAAALARAVPGIERVGPLHVRLHRALVLGEQPVADGERAGLVELHRLQRHRLGLLRFRRAHAYSPLPDAGADRAEPAQDRFRGRPGAARELLALELVGDDVGVEVEERHLLELVGARVLEQLPQRGPRDRAAAEPGDHRVALQLDPGQRLAHAVGDDAAQADGEALLEHDDALRVGERVAQRGQRERAERADRHRPDRDPIGAHLVDDLLHGAVDRTQRHDDRLGVGGAVIADEAARSRARTASRTRPRAGE